MNRTIAHRAVTLGLSLTSALSLWSCSTRPPTADAGTDVSTIDVYDAGPGMTVTWQTNLGALGARAAHAGAVIGLNCPADGFPGLVFGSGPYAGFSSICTAAVHAGRLLRADGGYTVIQTVAGLSHYTGSLHHEIYSGDWTEDQVPPEPAFVFLSPVINTEEP